MGSVYREQRLWVIACYVLHLLGAVLGLPSIIALIINYVVMDEAVPELQSHHRWMIRTFWWALLWSILAFFTWWLFVGMLIAAVVWVWWLYRQIRGLLRLADHLSMPL